MTTNKVKHQPDNQSFVVDFGEQIAYMRYRIFEKPLAAEKPLTNDEKPLASSKQPLAGSEVDFYTTFVPDSLRGQGIAAQLVESGFAWADEQGLKIKASCWYAAKKLERRQAGR